MHCRALTPIGLGGISPIVSKLSHSLLASRRSPQLGGSFFCPALSCYGHPRSRSDGAPSTPSMCDRATTGKSHEPIAKLIVPILDAEQNPRFSFLRPQCNFYDGIRCAQLPAVWFPIGLFPPCAAGTAVPFRLPRSCTFRNFAEQKNGSLKIAARPPTPRRGQHVFRLGHPLRLGVPSGDGSVELLTGSVEQLSALHHAGGWLKLPACQSRATLTSPTSRYRPRDRSPRHACETCPAFCDFQYDEDHSQSAT
jgi:hypothetical protein